MTDQELFARLTDEDALALTIYGEARGEPLHGQAAVGCVVRNRTKDPRWPDTYKGVCLQPKQFSCWNPGFDANAQAVRTMGERLVSGGNADPALRQCGWIAAGVIDGIILDATKGADHYMTEQLYRLATPKWARAMRETARIGSHVFLKG